MLLLIRHLRLIFCCHATPYAAIFLRHTLRLRAILRHITPIRCAPAPCRYAMPSYAMPLSPLLLMRTCDIDMSFLLINTAMYFFLMLFIDYCLRHAFAATTAMMSCLPHDADA